MGNAKFMQAIVDNCGGQGMMPPITVFAVSRDGSLFCLRVTSEENGGAELLCSQSLAVVKLGLNGGHAGGPVQRSFKVALRVTSR